MKFDDLLAAYLYEHKMLRLEGIGTFVLDEKVRVPGEQDKDVFYPAEGLSFTYNPKTAADESVISFLVKRLAKIEPLVRSDLEFYLANIKVLLNIGNPYTIKGIGTLNKNIQGQYEFTPGNFSPAKEELNPRRENEEHNYPQRSRTSAGRVFAVIIIVIAAIAALGGLGWAIVNFTSTRSAENTASAPEGIVADSASLGKDTSATKSATTAQNSSPLEDTARAKDKVAYKMIFEVTKSKERAIKRTQQLNSLNSRTTYDSIPINDSVAYYRLYLPVKIAPADSSRVKDSLKVFFGKRIFIAKQ